MIAERRVTLISLLMILLLCSPSVSKAQDTSDLVVPELYVNVKSLKEGGIFEAGVLFKIKAGWHLYWKHPGESGLATKLDLRTDPEGFPTGELRWPVPIKFTQTGGVVGYGYEHEVFLSAPLTVASWVKKGERVTISADAVWLACSANLCVPGKKQVSTVLPVRNGDFPVNTELFEGWAKKLPLETDSSEVPAKVTVTGSLGSANKEAFAISSVWEGVAPELQFIPAPPDSLAVMNVSMKNVEKSSTVNFDAAVLPGLKLPADQLESLLVYDDAHGVRRAIRVFVPLR